MTPGAKTATCSDSMSMTAADGLLRGACQDLPGFFPLFSLGFGGAGSASQEPEQGNGIPSSLVVVGPRPNMLLT